MSILDLKPQPSRDTPRPPQIRTTVAQDVKATARAAWYRRKGPLSLAIGVIALCFAAAWLIYSWLTSGQVVSLSSLELATVTRGEFVQDVSARGTVIAAVSPTLAATAPGTVHYLVHAGDQVRTGEVLATLESPDLDNQYQRQLATLESMNAALAEDRIKLRQQLLDNQQQANLAAVRMNAELRSLQRSQAAWALRDRDFGVSITAPRGGELRDLVEAYNTLGDLLRRERFDVYQRELLLDTVLQTTPLALVLSNDAGRIVYGNIAARQLLKGGHRLEGVELADLLAAQSAELRDAFGRAEDALLTLPLGQEREIYHLACRDFLLHTQPHRLWLLKRLTREIAGQEIEIWKKVIRVIAHELNNSLAPISSLAHSGTLLAGTLEAEPPGARLERIFATISERAQHLATFIDGYARFAKLPKPRLTPVDWAEFLGRLRAAFAFRLESEPPARVAHFDAAQLEQVMINLLKNATESGSPPQDITVSVHPRPEGFLIEVADRGTGLAEAVLRDALLPFFSTKPSGTGLGLTLCREIIEAHGGRLSLANRPGGGAIVSVCLP